MNLLVCSLQDPASVNIRDSLLERSGWKEGEEFEGSSTYRNGLYQMLTIKELHIRYDNIDRRVQGSLMEKPETVIFLSRHRAVSGTHSLTVHPIGNYGKAEYGGREGTLVPSAPDLMTSMLRRLRMEAEGLNFEVAFEVTHHGPYLETPTLFVEIGSSEETWRSKEAATAIASSILSVKEDKSPHAIGIGGGHYAPRFTEVSLSKRISFGHMLPNYAIDFGNEEQIRMNIKKALDGSKANSAYIHKKSMKKSEVTKIVGLLEDINVEVVDSSQLDEIR